MYCKDKKYVSSGVFQKHVKHVKKLVARARQPGTSHRGDIGSDNARQKRRFPVVGKGRRMPADHEIFHKAYSMIQLHSGK